MKSLLTFCIAGFIGFCGGDKDADKASEAAPVPEVSIVQEDVQPDRRPVYYRQTPSGNYLAGQFAQRRQDWDSAIAYMGRVLEHDPDNPDLRKRTMILAAGSGETARATAIARKVLADEPQNVLALLIVTLDRFSRQDYAGADTTLKQMPDGGMAEFIRPILQAWAQAGMGAAGTDIPLNPAANPLHAYHAMLIADYLGQNKNIISYADKALQNDTVDAHALEKIAGVLARHGAPDKALDLYRTVAEQSVSGRGLDAKIQYLEAGKPPEALPGNLPLAAPEQGAAEALFDMARILFREYSDDSAIVFARMALELNPKMKDANLLLATILTRHDRFAEAIMHYRALGPEDDSYLDAQRQAANLTERMGDRAAAIEILNGLYERYDDIDALILIGDIDRRAEDFAMAVAAYDRAAEALGGNVPEGYWHMLYARGMALEQAGDWGRSEKDLLAALEYRPNNPYVMNYLGYSWADQGKNLGGSLELIKKAAALRPGDGYIVDSLGWVLYRMKQYEEAVPYLERAAELLPYDSTINDHLGDAYWRTGRKAEARFQWQRALNYAEDGDPVEEISAKLQDGLRTDNAPAVQEAKTAAPGTLKR